MHDSLNLHSYMFLCFYTCFYCKNRIYIYIYIYPVFVNQRTFSRIFLIFLGNDVRSTSKRRNVEIFIAIYFLKSFNQKLLIGLTQMTAIFTSRSHVVVK